MSLLMVDEEHKTETFEEEGTYLQEEHTEFSSSIESPSPSVLLLDEIPSETLHKCSFTDAKCFLSLCSGSANDSIWNHLSDVIKRILEERPENIIDSFEDLSLRIKEEKFETVNNHIQKLYVSPFSVDFARRNIELIKALGYQRKSEEDENQNEKNVVEEGAEEEETTTSSEQRFGFLQFMGYFREAGVGLTNEEAYMINVSLMKLEKTKPVRPIRFWGKIFGLKKDYFIAECDLDKNEITRREEEAQKEAEGTEEEEEKLNDEEKALQKKENERVSEEITPEERPSEGEDQGKEPPVLSLRDQYQRPKTPIAVEEQKVEIESEPYGEGMNKKVFFVCNEIGEDWIELPKVTPLQIQVARKIKRYFTGDLESEINVYPIFPGVEKNYLRAQIARISSSTHISPLGYYTFGGDGEEEEEEDEEQNDEEEEEEGKTSFVENSQYEPITMEDLTDPTMTFWVHHSYHLLKQGRAKFWKPGKIKDEEEQEEAEEEQEEEEEEKEDEGEVENALPLLTPLAGDTSLETKAIWDVRQTSLYAKENSVAFVSSSLWPGAYAFACGRSYGNIYIGWGHKYLARGFSPQPLPTPEGEYEIGPEVMEMTDPTPEMEKEWEESQKKKEIEKPTEEGEEEEEENEDEDEEDED